VKARRCNSKKLHINLEKVVSKILGKLNYQVFQNSDRRSQYIHNIQGK